MFRPPEIDILLVEDEAPKRQHIERFIDQLFRSATVRIARSVNGAYDAIEARMPDLLLLDMSLPTFDIGDRETGGRPQGFGGIEILRYMAAIDIICPTIVITGYDAFPRQGDQPVGLADLRGELEAEFPQLLRGVLHYNSTVDEWKIALNRIFGELGMGDKA